MRLVALALVGLAGPAMADLGRVMTSHCLRPIVEAGGELQRPGMTEVPATQVVPQGAPREDARFFEIADAPGVYLGLLDIYGLRSCIVRGAEGDTRRADPAALEADLQTMGFVLGEGCAKEEDGLELRIFARAAPAASGRYVIVAVQHDPDGVLDLLAFERTESANLTCKGDQ